MEQLSDITRIIALTMGVGWAAGINLYATIAVLGILGATGNMSLPPDLQILAEPLIIGVAGVLYVVEFFADKTPGVDSGWDTLHTFIRIPAGALLAAGAVGEVSPVISLAAALVGGSLAAGSHGLKAGVRLLVNTSPEPFSNWAASISEDAMVIGGVWLAVMYPSIFLGLLILFILVMIWLLPKVWRGIRTMVLRIRRFFTGDRTSTMPDTGSEPLALDDGRSPENRRQVGP
ncbi:DUF4126 domain-containing protein [Desulfosarcina sp. OttesenSCG-928-A07]|nr:DUF4126 domain-containing protein [Desulfosarcina sp. OttesenSCG-928-A07]